MPTSLEGMEVGDESRWVDKLSNKFIIPSVIQGIYHEALHDEGEDTYTLGRCRRDMG